MAVNTIATAAVRRYLLGTEVSVSENVRRNHRDYCGGFPGLEGEAPGTVTAFQPAGIGGVKSTGFNGFKSIDVTRHSTWLPLTWRNHTRSGSMLLDRRTSSAFSKSRSFAPAFGSMLK